MEGGRVLCNKCCFWNEIYKRMNQWIKVDLKLESCKSDGDVCMRMSWWVPPDLDLQMFPQEKKLPLRLNSSLRRGVRNHDMPCPRMRWIFIYLIYRVPLNSAQKGQEAIKGIILYNWERRKWRPGYVFLALRFLNLILFLCLGWCRHGFIFSAGYGWTVMAAQVPKVSKKFI